jgi:hypothetical protein
MAFVDEDRQSMNSKNWETGKGGGKRSFFSREANK